MDAFNETMVASTPGNRNIDSKWSHLRDGIYNSANSDLGKKEHRNADWYKAHWAEIPPVVEEKRKALLTYKLSPCVSTRDSLRATRAKEQKIAAVAR